MRVVFRPERDARRHELRFHPIGRFRKIARGMSLTRRRVPPSDVRSLEVIREESRAARPGASSTAVAI